jgi:hypothetical protein
MTHDGGVDEDEQGLGDECAERGDREGKDLPVDGVAGMSTR